MRAGSNTLVANRRIELLKAVAFSIPYWRKKNTAAPSRIPRSANEMGRSVFTNRVDVVALKADDTGID